MARLGGYKDPTPTMVENGRSGRKADILILNDQGFEVSVEGVDVSAEDLERIAKAVMKATEYSFLAGVEAALQTSSSKD